MLPKSIKGGASNITNEMGERNMKNVWGKNVAQNRDKWKNGR